MKNLLRRGAVALAVTSVATFMLVSCSSEEQFSEATPTALPTVGDQVIEQPVSETLRFLGEDSEGMTYYAGRWDEGDQEQYCLLMIRGEQWQKSCSPQLPLTGTLADVRAVLSDGATHVDVQDKSVEIVGKYLEVSRQ